MRAPAPETTELKGSLSFVYSTTSSLGVFKLQIRVRLENGLSNIISESLNTEHSTWSLKLKLCTWLGIP